MTDFERGGQASIFAIDPSQKTRQSGLQKLRSKSGTIQL